MQENLIIEKVSFDDQENLKALMLEALESDPLAFSVDYEEYALNSSEWWNSYISGFLYGFRAFMFFAKADGRNVGMAGGILDRGNRRKHLASVVWVYVNKEYRKKGIAKKLMQAVMDEIQKNPEVLKVSLMVNAPQENALTMYKNLGFKIVGTLEKEMKINNEFYNEYIMEKFIH